MKLNGTITVRISHLVSASVIAAVTALIVFGKEWYGPIASKAIDTLVLDGCWEWREMKRVTSPDNPYTKVRLDALVVAADCGATTSEDDRVYVVPKGVTPSYEREDFFPYQLSATYVDGLDVHWVSPKRLEIRYSEAKIDGFRNHWKGRTNSAFHQYVVEIRLKPMKEPWSLSAGDQNMPK